MHNRSIIFLVLITSLCLPIIDAWNSDKKGADKSTYNDALYDFGNVNWGMTVDEVLQIEGKMEMTEIDKYHVILKKDAKVLGFKSTLIYKFYFDKLCAALYVLKEEHKALQEYIIDYTKIQYYSERQYGPAVRGVETIWKNPHEKKEVDHYGEALKQGELTLMAMWDFYNMGPQKETKELFIEHIIHNDNGEIVHLIIYYSFAYTKALGRYNRLKNKRD